MFFAKKHNTKGLKMVKANNAKAMSTHVEVIKTLVKHKNIKPKIPQGCDHKVSGLAYIAYPTLGKYICTHITKGL